MDGEDSSPPLPEPEPPRKGRRVLGGDSGKLSAIERDALLDRIDEEIGEIDGRDETGGESTP